MIQIEAVPASAVLIDTVPLNVIGRSAQPRQRVARKARKRILTPGERKVLDRYSDAYKAVYGVRPVVNVDGKWFRILGHDAGVSKQRLNAMAAQLEFRIG